MSSMSAKMKRRRVSMRVNAFLPLCGIQRCGFLHHGSSSSSLSPHSPLIVIHSRRKVSDSAKRLTISANSLEDSKRRAKSSYDNIPDVNQQYIAELNWVEQKYGPKRLKDKYILKESQQSILRGEGVARPVSRASEVESDLSPYETIRNELITNTLFVGGVGLCGLWGFGTLRDVESFAIGFVGSVAYVVLLSRSVDRLAEAAKANGGQGGDALQAARIAILVLLVLGCAKNRDKVDILPVLFGFFTYKVATLLPLVTGEAFDSID